MKQLLLIFARSSQPLHQLQSLFSAAEDCPADKFVLYDGFIPVKEVWDNDHYQKYIQLGVDKTEKMMNAFIKGFLKGYEKIVLVDHTSPALNRQLIESAFSDLDQAEILFGPVQNDSLYLLGMDRLRPEIFEGEINRRNLESNLQKRKIRYKEYPLLESWVQSKVSV